MDYPARDPPEWRGMTPNELIDRLTLRVSTRIREGDPGEPWELIAEEFEKATGLPLDRADEYHVMLGAAIFNGL